MGYRKLRITWSVVCGLAALLTLVFWVRSYWMLYELKVPISNSTFVDAALLPGELLAILRDGTIGTWAIDHATPEQARKPRQLSGPFFFSKGRVGVPTWFVLCLSSSLAALPWVRPRFSLRALLIATTVVAMLLSLTVWPSHR